MEICVKFTKRLIYGSIRNCVVNYHDFELLICQTIQLINSRLVAFKECLRDDSNANIPPSITPEILIRGREFVVSNVIPAMQSDPEDEWKSKLGTSDGLRDEFEKAHNIRAKLTTVYKEELLTNLVGQAVDRNFRYKPVPHVKLKKGDIVLLKEQHAKSSNYRMAVVKQVVTNINDELTAIVAMKGNREIVKRSATSVIKPFAPEKEPCEDGEPTTYPENEIRVPRRGQARKCHSSFKDI